MIISYPSDKPITSLPSFALATGLVLLSYLVFKFVSIFWLSPLKHVPGPYLAAWTAWWISYHDLAGDRTSILHNLHERYGSVVRIGPNEVSISDASAVKELYGQGSSYIKAHWYVYGLSTHLEGVAKDGVFTMRYK